MREAGSRRLIAVSSLGGVLGQPFQDAYCASKFALEGLYESLRPLAARFGVHVSLVEPGPVDTGFRSSSQGFHLAEDGTRTAGGPHSSRYPVEKICGKTEPCVSLSNPRTVIVTF